MPELHTTTATPRCSEQASYFAFQIEPSTHLSNPHQMAENARTLLEPNQANSSAPEATDMRNQGADPSYCQATANCARTTVNCALGFGKVLSRKLMTSMRSFCCISRQLRIDQKPLRPEGEQDSLDSAHSEISGQPSPCQYALAM